MIGIILCGSLETKLEQEIASLDPDHELGPLAGVPRALLPINGVSILDRWLHILREKQSVSEIFLVSNGLRYKYFERWATGHGLGVDHVVNNGCTRASASLGAVNDLRLGLERAKFLGSYACATASSSSSVKEAVGGRDVLVVGADHLFHCGFSLDGFLRFYNSRRTQRPDMSFCFCYKVCSFVLQFWLLWVVVVVVLMRFCPATASLIVQVPARLAQMRTVCLDLADSNRRYKFIGHCCDQCE